MLGASIKDLMRSQGSSSRGGLLAAVVLVPLLVDCARDERRSPASALPSAEMVPTALRAESSASVLAQASAVASINPELLPGAHRRSVAPEKVPSEPTPSAVPTEEQTDKRTGEFKDRGKAHEGLPSPNTTPPLGVLKDLPDLPASTLIYRKSGHLMRVSLPSGKETPLSSGAFNDSDPRWTRDGKYLFFLSTREGAKSKIFRQKFPDGKAEAVTMALRTGDCSFDWAVSDDGARVAYVNAQEGMEHDVTLVTVATGKEETIFRGDFPEDLAFSRDGAALLLISGGRTAPKLYEIDLGTRRAKALPNSGYQLMEHPFSLQDGRVAFSASLSFGMMERDPSLFTMPAGGGAWTCLGTLSAPVGYMSRTLSPDGKKIAVQRSVHQGKFSVNWHTDVSVMALDGRYGKPLARSFPQPFHALIDPSWGPTAATWQRCWCSARASVVSSASGASSSSTPAPRSPNWCSSAMILIRHSGPLRGNQPTDPWTGALTRCLHWLARRRGGLAWSAGLV